MAIYKHRVESERRLLEKELQQEINERKQLEQEKAMQAKVALLSAEVNSAITGSNTLRSLLQLCAEAIVRNLNTAFARIWTVNWDKNMLELQASAGMYTHLDGDHARIPVGKLKIGLIVKDRKPFLTNKVLDDVPGIDKDWAKREGMVAFAGYPLIVEDQVIGVIGTFSQQPLLKAVLKNLETVASGIAIGIKRMQAEATLKKSEERFNLALDAVEEGVWDWNVQTNEIYFSPRWEALYGYKAGEVEPHFRSLEKMVHPDDEKLVMKAFNDHVEGRTDSYNVEHRVKTKSGGWVWTLGRGKIVERDEAGKPLRVVGTARDITEKKEAEKALRKSEKKFRSLAESSQDYIMLYDRECRHLYQNPACLKVAGFNEENIIGKTHREAGFDPLLCDQWEKRIRKVFATGKTEGEIFEWESANGKVFLDWRLTPVLDETGKVETVMGISTDITERKEAEKSLKEEKNKMSAIVEAIEHGMTIQNLDYDIIYQNKQLSDIFGNMGEKCYKVYEGKDSVCDGCPVEMGFKDGKSHTSERKVVMPSGEINFWENTANPIRDASGNIISCLEITRNITHRKQEEEALAESEEKYREVVETTNDLITRVDFDGKFLFVNHMAEKFFGISPEHCIGQSAFDFIHPDDREDTQKTFKDWVTQKITYTTYENRQVNKSGQIFNMLWTINFRYDAKKKLIGLNSIARDITERKKMEDQIKASLQEKKVLLREIHHRVKNNMQVISSLLTLQSEYLNDEKDIELFKESQNRIKSMAIIHENLYQSEDLAKIDFRDYVKKLSYELLKSYNIYGNQIDLKIDIKDVLLGIEAAIPCSLIINELISNSIKYAFPEGKRGKIKISMSKKKDGEIELIVADNGVSIPKHLDFKNAKTLGLQLVTDLAEDQLDGEIELNISKGTEFRIRFKELQHKKRV